MPRLDHRAILKAKTCDLKRLPLGAREAFVLSHLDGRLTLEEVAEVAGFTVSDVVGLANQLVELGAATPSRDSGRPPRGARLEEVRGGRPDPRAERVSQAPSQRSVRPGRASKSIPKAARKSVPALIAPAPPPRRKSTKKVRAQPTGTTAPEERMRKVRAAAMEIKVQALFDGLVEAAEQALKKDDIIGAANNLRLALQHRDDPYVRMKLDDIDGRSRTVRAERNVLLARAAERDQRWADAGAFYAKAHEARPEAAMAERAAYALGMAGELVRAVALAEQAVALDQRNVVYRVTLGRAYLAASKMARAEAELGAARELAPKDARVKELGAAIAKRRATSRQS
jgi:hypothetical protein